MTLPSKSHFLWSTEPTSERFNDSAVFLSSKQNKMTNVLVHDCALQTTLSLITQICQAKECWPDRISPSETRQAHQYPILWLFCTFRINHTSLLKTIRQRNDGSTVSLRAFQNKLYPSVAISIITNVRCKRRHTSLLENEKLKVNGGTLSLFSKQDQKALFTWSCLPKHPQVLTQKEQWQA
jgi:hypothetical protein